MGKMKELYLEQQQAVSGSGDEDYIYEQYLNQEKMNEEYWEWMARQEPTDLEIDSINDSIKPKYSDWDITSVLHEVLGDANPDTDDILIRLNNLYNIKNGYTD
jgi:hypothetical protein